ncbi:amidohydrolase family protein [Streptomyces sp. KL116D]|uniref:amidohydrolase family protein n=1 Tax=Streptomyces sp. KL116D TaxID=3045152 RepID=UPI003557A099
MRNTSSPGLAAYGASSASILQPEKWREASRRLLDVTGERLAEMDAAGLDMQVLSLNAPGIQAESDAGTAVSRAAAVNDLLASVVADHPGRFAGFAALPLQDPQAAAKELERAVSQLGLRGVLVNAHTQGRYLDDPALRGVWERLEGLDVPLYLHPANGVGTPHVIEGHPELVGPMWSWGTETATHFLRLVFGGVFDDFPRARVLLGHMGEGPPYLLWRLDSRWDYHAHHGVELALGRPSEYVRRNLHITTSGVRSPPPLLCALLALERTTFSSAPTIPFEGHGDGHRVPAHGAGQRADRSKIAHRNAERLLGL